MSLHETIIERLETLKAALAEVGTREEIAAPDLRASLEACVEEAERSAPEIGRLLRLAVQGLDAASMAEVPDAEMLAGAVLGAIEAASAHMAGGADDAMDIEQCAEDLQKALDAARAGEGASRPLETRMCDLAAVMLGLEPTDRDELERVRAALLEAAGSESASERAREMARASAEHIRSVIEGDADDPHAALCAAGRAAQEFLDAAGGDDGPMEPVREDAESPEAGVESEEVDAAGAALPLDADPDLLREFVVESLDHIEAAEASLLELEAEPEQSEPIHTVFRAFHTIKGSSAFLGLGGVERLAHLAEGLLTRARDGDILLTGGYADLALQSCDTLKAMIEGLQGMEPGTAFPVPDGYEDLVVRLADPDGAGISGEPSDDAVAVPRVGDILVAEGKVTREEVEVAARDQGPTPIGETLVKFGAASAADVGQALRTQRRMARLAASDTTVRISTDRLDSLLNMVGELVIAQSMIAQAPDVLERASARLSRNIAHTGKITRELQDLAMALRMVPLRPTFQKMARLVRDLAHKSDKQLQFVAEGEDTEIDRNMVEALNDPLVHMIRNAVDHGIEPPQERVQRGKDSTGTLRLRAYHSAGNVVIEVQDDGRGLDLDKILGRAVEKGLVESGRDLPDDEVYNLIFHPGFSTAEQVTEVSGRGVGMDVVKRGIESLRGRVEVASELGAGCTFTIRLPLTMAIIDAMLVRVGGERYLLPTVAMEESFR
ncbi:MAG: chemotaxis protein CheA, partial [Armatimonadota bacterium]